MVTKALRPKTKKKHDQNIGECCSVSYCSAKNEVRILRKKSWFFNPLMAFKRFCCIFFFKHGPLTMIRAVAVASSHGRGGVVDNAADSCSRVLGSILAVNFDMHERGILGL